MTWSTKSFNWVSKKENWNARERINNQDGESKCWNRTAVEKECMKFKVDILCQQFQLLKEGISKDDIDIVLAIVHD